MVDTDSSIISPDILEFFGDKPMQQRDQTKFSHGAFYFDGQYLFGMLMMMMGTVT